MITLRNIGHRTVHSKEGSLPKKQSKSFSDAEAKRLLKMYPEEFAETKDDPTIESAPAAPAKAKAAPAKAAKEPEKQAPAKEPEQTPAAS